MLQSSVFVTYLLMQNTGIMTRLSYMHYNSVVTVPEPETETYVFS